MSQQPGWYPNPDGTPQTLRLWDGTRWTGDVRPDPSQPNQAPDAYPPAPAAGYAAPGARTSGPKVARLWLGGVAAVVVLVVLAAVVLSNLRTPTPAPTPIPSPSTAVQVPTAACAAPTQGQVGDGYATLTLPGAQWHTQSAPPWATCGALAARPLAGTWSTLLGVGTIVNAGNNPEATAQATWRWAQQAGYRDAAPTASVTSSAPVTIQGKPAWKLQGTIKATPHDGISGGAWTFVVIPHGDGTSSVAFGVSAIEDAANATEVDTALASLRLG